MSDLFLNTELGSLLERAVNMSQEDLFVQVFSENRVQQLVVDLNKSQLRNQYMNSEGVLLSSVRGDYSPVTIEISKAKGRPKAGQSSIDLYDTGEFHASFKVSKVTGTSFEITANPIKDDGTNLLNEWGEEVLGLTFESIDKVVDFIIPIYRIKLVNYLLNK